MQQQTQTAKQQLKTFRDKIEASREKNDAEIKTSLKSAQAQLEQAHENIEAQMENNETLNDTDRQELLAHMKNVTNEMMAALKDEGTSLRKRIGTILDNTEELLTRDY